MLLTSWSLTAQYSLSSGWQSLFTVGKDVFLRPLSLRPSNALNERWVLGPETTGHLFFSDVIYTSLGMSFHYFAGT